MLTNLRSAAFFALAALASVLTNLRSAAFFAIAALSSVWTFSNYSFFDAKIFCSFHFHSPYNSTIRNRVNVTKVTSPNVTVVTLRYMLNLL